MPTVSVTITTAWVPPPALTGLQKTVMEEFSHILLVWTGSSLSDVDFEKYTVYRRVVNDVAWAVIGTITDKSTAQWIDVYAGVGILYEYKVTQWKVIVGDVPLESADGDIAEAMLESDVWFVIGRSDPTDTANSFELPVSSETHTRPIQQELFEPIVGVRKKVARGNTLGYEGSIDLRYMSSERVAAKIQLMFLAEVQGPHVLKSPFGDVWLVEFDSPDYRYLGGGNLDVQIGWVEVS